MAGFGVVWILDEICLILGLDIGSVIWICNGYFDGVKMRWIEMGAQNFDILRASFIT